ncbi:hypothetical protein [Candidatus Pelagibacter sp. Uisw_136]|jgi:hypothetical protein
MLGFQALIPQLQTKMNPDDEFLFSPVDNLFPFLEDKEYYSNIKLKIN